MANCMKKRKLIPVKILETSYTVFLKIVLFRLYYLMSNFTVLSLKSSIIKLLLLTNHILLLLDIPGYLTYTKNQPKLDIYSTKIIILLHSQLLNIKNKTNLW